MRERIDGRFRGVSTSSGKLVAPFWFLEEVDDAHGGFQREHLHSNG